MPKGSTHSKENSSKKPRITPFKLYQEDLLKKHQNDPGFDKVLFAEQAKLDWKNLSDKKKVLWINWALDKENKYQVQIL